MYTAKRIVCMERYSARYDRVRHVRSSWVALSLVLPPVSLGRRYDTRLHQQQLLQQRLMLLLLLEAPATSQKAETVILSVPLTRQSQRVTR
jgi:hypothetical protein